MILTNLILWQYCDAIIICFTDHEIEAHRVVK